MKNKFKINIGDRITYHNEFFEICYINGNTIRYSNFNSGNMYFITEDDLLQKISCGDMKFTSLSMPQLHKNRSLSRDEIFHYLKYIFSNKISCSVKHLKLAIINVTNENSNIRKISASTLARYIKIYRDNSESFDGFYKEMGGNKSLRFPIEVEKIINEIILDIIKNKEDFTPLDAHLLIKNRILSLDPHARIPSERTIYRRFERLDPYIIFKNKKGKKEADKIFKASGQKLVPTGLMSIVEIDTHEIDCIILDKNGNILGRPQLCIIIEIYTRVIIGWHLCMLPPSATKSLLALKNMLTRPNIGRMGGIPTKVIPDNGCEFNNNAIINFCNTFSITKTESQPFYPDNKPHVERFFRTLNECIVHKLKGTTFSSPVERGDYDSGGSACFTLESLRDLVDDWIENIYHKSIHAGTQQRPEKMWKDAEKIFPVLSIPQIEVDKKCRTVFRYTIKKGQINLKGLRYKSHALATLGYIFKDKVTIYVDQLNLSSIYVQDPFNKSNLIQADSIYPEATKDLSLAEWLEAKDILREKYKTDPDEIKNEELLYLARLNFLLKIQSLNKTKKRFKQIKNDLPMMIKQLEENLNLVSPNLDPVSNINTSKSSEIESPLSYDNLSADLTEYFYEEINLDE